VSRSPNVRGGRRLLSVKVDPATFAKLGPKPATKAAEVLDAWAETHRPATDESAPVEGPPPPSSGRSGGSADQGR